MKMQFLIPLVLMGLIPMELQSQENEQLALTELSGIVIDGNLSDWPEASFKSDLTKSGKRSFTGPEDLTFQYAVSSQGNHLLFAIRWLDDQLDTQQIPLDSARWQHPSSGNSMDRMYLFDGVKLQILMGSIQYDAWLAPRPLVGSSPVQWETLGIRRGKKEEVQLLQVISVKAQDGFNEMEMRIDLQALGKTSSLNNFKISWTVIDQDSPGSPLVQKLNELVYFYKQSDYKID